MARKPKYGTFLILAFDNRTLFICIIFMGFIFSEIETDHEKNQQYNLLGEEISSSLYSLCLFGIEDDTRRLRKLQGSFW